MESVFKVIISAFFVWCVGLWIKNLINEAIVSAIKEAKKTILAEDIFVLNNRLKEIVSEINILNENIESLIKERT